jgi:hypothetical protein
MSVVLPNGLGLSFDSSNPVLGANWARSATRHLAMQPNPAGLDDPNLSTNGSRES